MAKCFITGVDLPLEEAYILDIGAAHRALRNLRQRGATIERLIEQLSLQDDAEAYDIKTHTRTTRKNRRLVSRSVAEALSVTYPEESLFIVWTEYCRRRHKNKNSHGQVKESRADTHKPVTSQKKTSADLMRKN